MRLYLIFQNTYDTVQIGLFQDNVLMDFHEVHKHHLSKDFMLLVLGLLQHHKVRFKDLSFIGVNVGPSPFTTIRALLAAVNGINFATALPLVGVDGLVLLAKAENDALPTGILLNAFNNDVYFAYPSGDDFVTGYRNISLLLPELKTTKIKRLIGNAVSLHQELIVQALPEIVLEPEPSHPTLENIALQATMQFENSKTQQELFPLYTKAIAYKKSL